MRKSRTNEGQRVAQEVAAIRAALHQQGYKTRKRARQPIWTIYVTADRFYQLSFQPAPISGWVLYPYNDDPNRHALITIIRSVLTKRPAGISGTVS